MQSETIKPRFDRLNDLLKVVKGIKPKKFDQELYWQCGSTGCQIGHYAHRFPRRGLDKELMRSTKPFSVACAKHFQITTTAAADLFDSDACSTKREAIHNLTTFIARKRKEFSHAK